MSNHPSIHQADSDASYTLEIVSRITGVSSETIIHYQQHGLILRQQDSYDEEAIRTLRRLEHLREVSGANVSGLKLILDLMQEVEQLRATLRRQR